MAEYGKRDTLECYDDEDENFGHLKDLEFTEDNDCTQRLQSLQIVEDVDNTEKRRFFREMKVADEQFKKALNRQGELSTFDALQLRNVKSLFTISFIYYFLYSVFTQYFSDNEQGFNLSYFQQGTALLLLLASFLSIRFFHGRKTQVLYCGLIINASAEFFQVVVMYTLNCGDSTDHEFTQFNLGRLFHSSDKW